MLEFDIAQAYFWVWGIKSKQKRVPCCFELADSNFTFYIPFFRQIQSCPLFLCSFIILVLKQMILVVLASFLYVSYKFFKWTYCPTKVHDVLYISFLNLSSLDGQLKLNSDWFSFFFFFTIQRLSDRGRMLIIFLFSWREMWLESKRLKMWQKSF